jgi:hypothetical protein
MRRYRGLSSAGVIFWRGMKALENVLDADRKGLAHQYQASMYAPDGRLRD